MFALAGLEHWAWLIAGLLLVGLETLAPGIFLVWLGIAAILTGVVDYALAPSWQVSLIVFAGLALLSVMAGRLAAGSRGRPEDRSMLNRRGDALVGRSFTLDQPITAGEGRVRVDDSVWRVIGPDLPAGAVVRVARIEGATLVVDSTAGL